MLFGLFLFLPNQSKATHLVGGEISFVQDTNLTFTFTLTLYRDCSGISLPNTASMDVSVVNCTTNVNTSFNLTQVGPPVEITNPCATGLSVCQGGQLPGIEKYVYVGTYTFPFPCGNWKVSYDNCCRNGALTSIASPSAQTFYIETEINNYWIWQGFTNSSPVFDPIVYPYLCNANLNNFDFTAVDAEGDSLLFQLVSAEGAPGQNLSYNTGFSPTNPLNTTGGINFNPSDGTLSMTPSQLAYPTFKVKVTETRNGNFLSSTVRDISVPVLACTSQGPCANQTVSGFVYQDLNSTCVMDSGDYMLQGWLVEANPGPFYALTNALGYYEMALDTGNYTISVNVPNAYWNQTCPVANNGTYNVSLNPGANVNGIDFGAETQPGAGCPQMNVSVSNNQLRPCNFVYYYVNYSNTGPTPAFNSQITLTVDSTALSYQSTNGNLASSNHPNYVFNVGTVNPGQSGSFYVRFFSDCDSSLMGQTLCATAHITPDSLCSPIDSTWDKSSVSVTGGCVGDSLVCFTITNTGSPSNGNMAGTSDWRLYENGTLAMAGTFQLCGGCDTTLCFTANGNTLRLEADQRPGHPGNSNPNTTIELCGSPGQSIGMVNLLPQDDSDPFIDINCDIVVNSWDPNDKQATPKGLTNMNYIQKNAMLEYKVRFQNTGTASAIDVAIEDTLSQFLDLTSVVPGASSHNITNFSIHSNGVLRWEFDGIMLPDSGADFAGSQGFVTFKVKQTPNNPIGTVIENRAAIVFDSNPAIITNNVVRRIGEPQVLSAEPFLWQDQVQVLAFPNPMTDLTTIQIKGLRGDEPVTVSLFTLHGQEIRQLSGRADQSFRIERSDLPQGIYIFSVKSGNELLGSGKILMTN